MSGTTKYRAASAALRQALDRADRLVDQLDARGLTHVLLHDWQGHSLSERVTYELGEIVSDLLDQQAATSLDKLGAAVQAIGSALLDRDLRCDDCLRLLTPEGTCSCTPVTRG